MPAKSRQQQKLIYAKRDQYGSKEKAPEEWKWVFDDEWSDLEENTNNERLKLRPYKRMFEERGF